MAHSSLDVFISQLQNTLNHFYDPLFHPEDQVFILLDLEPSQGMDAVRHALRTQIEGMKPDISIPSGAHTPSYRFFEILKQRYLNSVSQDEAAFQLGMTPRNLRRIQHQAVFALAQRIWEFYPVHAEPLKHQPEHPVTPLNADHQPILRELEVLQRNSPGAVADLSESLDRTQTISTAANNHRPVQLKIQKPDIRLIIPIHPSVLDQILLSTLEQLGKISPGDSTQISVTSQENTAEVKITSPNRLTEMPFKTNPAILEMLNLVGGTQSISQQPDQLEICFCFPTVPQIHILLIDDNPDFVHLLRRYTRFTRYLIHNIRDGAQLQDAMAEFHPQLIILDVLLPDVDGWQLLIDLQKPFQGDPIPVIVCTALTQDDLAYSLGAIAYLQKPITREEFLKTLESIM